MYKLIKNQKGEVFGASKEENGVVLSFPFNPDNTDYQAFKKEVLAGAELQDADGNTMTTEEANAFIGTLS